MKHIEFFNKLLNLQPPWQVREAVLSEEEKRLDIYLGYKGIEKKLFFGFTKAKIGLGKKSICPHCNAKLPLDNEYSLVTIRHLETLGYPTYLHVPQPESVHSLQDDCICMRTWKNPGTNCSTALYNLVLGQIESLKDAKVVAKLLNLRLEEIRQILEVSGFVKKGTSKGPSGETQDSTTVTSIPELKHPNWTKLVKGQLSIKSKSVALGMVISHVQSMYMKTPTMETGIIGVKTLRQFFIKNEKFLEDEIAIINGQKRVNVKKITDNDTMQTSVPGESSDAWRKLVAEGLKISTRYVSLQMIIGQSQKAFARKHSEELLNASIRNIHDYFVKNEKVLSDEIKQLRDAEALS